MKRILILALFLLAVGLVALTLKGARPCPLAVRFDRLTDIYGVFVITNRSETPLQFSTLTESKSNGSWPTYPVGSVLPHSGPYDIGPHESRELTALLPAEGTFVRLSIACAEPWTTWEIRELGGWAGAGVGIAPRRVRAVRSVRSVRGRSWLVGTVSVMCP